MRLYTWLRSVSLVVARSAWLNGARLHRKLSHGMVLAGSLAIVATGHRPEVKKMVQIPNHPGAPGEVYVVTVGVGQERIFWLTGPWLDYASSVNPISGLSGQILNKKDVGGAGEVQIRLKASTSATRGIKFLSLNITCPFIPFDCVNGPVQFAVRVLETGPLSSFTASTTTSAGYVPAMTRVTFAIHGAGLALAKLSRWQPDVWEPVMVVNTTTIILIQATTPACGKSVKIYLRDKDDPWDDVFYRANYPELSTEPCVRR
jgi:hypothetical protein